MTRPGWPDLALCAAVALIAVATLVPGPSGAPSPLSWAPSPADFAVNFALFMPLGLALRASRRSPRTVLAAGAAISALIELGQLWFLPGRDASPWDLLANALGAWAPAALPAMALAVPLVLLWLVSSWLLAPAAPATRTWWGQWAHRFSSPAPFSGIIHAASLNGISTPDQSLGAADTERLQTRLRSAPWQLSVGMTPPSAPSPSRNQLAGIADGQGGEVIGLWQLGWDLELRWHARGTGWGLRQAAIRAPELLSGLPPAAVGISATIEPRNVFVEITSAHRYGLRLGPWQGWRLLWPVGAPVPWLGWLLSATWTLACLGPLALLSIVRWRHRRTRPSPAPARR